MFSHLYFITEFIFNLGCFYYIEIWGFYGKFHLTCPVYQKDTHSSSSKCARANFHFFFLCEMSDNIISPLPTPSPIQTESTQPNTAIISLISLSPFDKPHLKSILEILPNQQPKPIQPAPVPTFLISDSSSSSLSSPRLVLVSIY